MWHTLSIYQVNQQETLWQNSYHKGSSETVRKITFQFKSFITQKPEHKVTYSKSFLTWFIGFVEGDGSFVISKGKVYFDLTQDLKDIHLLYKIKTTLGFGSILTRTDNHRNVGVYYVTGKPNFLRLVHLFNGNIICNHKKTQFKQWLHVFNTQYNQQIDFIDNTIIPSFNNGWLAGFIDAEGYFSARIKKCNTSKSGKNILTDFAITQKYPDVLILIRRLFHLTQTNIRYDPSWHGYCFYLSNKKLLINLVAYLRKFPLKTKKRIFFFRWAKIHKFTLNKMHLTQNGLNCVTLAVARFRRRHPFPFF